MKLHQLEALVGVAQHGSIRAAARAMHLSQAALTKSLRQLESDCGLALLTRQASGVVLTESGQRLLQRSRLILRQLALAKEDFKQAQGDHTGVLRVGITPYLMQTVLGQAFGWFRERYPQVELSLVEGLVARVVPAIRDGSMDFAVVADTSDFAHAEFSRSYWLSEPQTVVVRKKHPLLKQVTAAKLAALEWVMPGPYLQGLDERFQDMFASNNIPKPSQVTRCDAMAALALVRMSDAVSVMPLSLLKQPAAQGLVAITLRQLQPPAIRVVQVSLADVPLTPAASYFARCLADALRASNPQT